MKEAGLGLLTGSVLVIFTYGARHRLQSCCDRGQKAQREGGLQEVAQTRPSLPLGAASWADLLPGILPGDADAPRSFGENPT